MFRSFDEKIFRKAIEEKDYLCLKSYIVSALRFDSTFERGEAQKAIDIINVETPEIFEEYMQKSYEKRLPREEWTEDYFIELTFWFQNNFAIERISHIKEVGKAVYPSLKTMSSVTIMDKQASDMNQHQTGEHKHAPKKRTYTSNPQRASEKKKSTVGPLLTAGALAIVGILLYKILSN